MKIRRNFPAATLSDCLICALLLAAVVSCPACSHYQKMSADYDTYSPPDMSPPIPPTLKPVENSRVDADFRNQKTRLEEMGRRWEDALNAPAADARFFSPSPDKLSALEPAGRDAAAAVRALSSGFTLETLEILALLRNQGVISAEKTFRSKLQAYSQVSNLDEVLRQYAAFTQAVMTGVGDMGDKESPAMKFPFPGVMALKGEIVDQEVKIAREELETARKTVVTDARKVFWNLAYNRRAQEITAATLELLDQLELSARKRYEVGKESLQDVIRVQIQQEKLREEWQTLKEEQKNLQTNIRNLVDLVPGSNIGFPAIREPRREHPAIDRVSDLAMEQSQELRTVRAMIGRMERMVEMAETEIYPRFTQNLSLFENKAVNQVGTIKTDAPFGDVASASSGEGLPKNSWFGLGDAYLRETREKLDALRKELKNTENVILFKIREGWFKLDLAIREERLYTKKIRELSRLSAEVTGLRYEAGVAEMRDVIEFYMTWFEARLTSERKKSEIEIARADLEEIIGTSL
ncbi:MAG: TolC family protein [Deltaproteobacteria bacterium]|nr:TolC family protein [Deltaproteobacteria bacterium]